MINIRAATPADLPWLLDQARAFDAFKPGRSRFPDISFAEQRLLGLIDHGVFLIAHGSESMGFICGFVSPDYFNPQLKLLTELLWWVAPEHRGSRAGHMLLDAFEAHGKKVGCDVVQMTRLANSPVSDRMLARRGYLHVESAYALEIT